jgi:SH3 domain-containing YSC84-like protein 1
MMIKAICSIFLLSLMAVQAPADDALKDVRSRVMQASMTFDEIMAAQDRAIPDSLLKNANCVAVFPSVVKAGFVFGATKGKGLVSCRTRTGWSQPLFLKLIGGSVGFQIGVSKTDVILAVMRNDSARIFDKANFTLGGDASVAAGPIGRSAEAGVNYQLTSEIYSYSRSRGVFAGVALKGTVIDHSDSANSLVYGGNRSIDTVLADSSNVPDVAKLFVDTLTRYAP